ncbi:hypothetical protein ACOJQI_13145 [Bacillus salacetis]|uniref:hypothetical protein n=1 Tax=Bacillus salacetis TaxID=2315464 RepID=UPI003BA3D409
MSQNFWLFTVVVFLLLLTGCRMEFSYVEELPESEEEAEEEKEEEEVEFISVDEQLESISVQDTTTEDGRINTAIDIGGMIEGSTHLKLKGKSNLQEGAVLTIVLQEYEDETGFSVSGISEGAEPTGPVLFEKDVVTGPQGEFYITVIRKDQFKYGKVTVTFRPERQNEEVQSIYGKHGENIGFADGSSTRRTYSVNGEEYSAYQVYAPADFLNAFSQLLKEYEETEQ